MSGRIFFGGLLVILGLGFLLEVLGFLEFGSLLETWWPLIIIAFAVIQLVSQPGSYLGAGIVLAVGLLLQAVQLDLLPGSIWTYFWPLLLIVIGGWLVLNRFRRPSLPAASPLDRMNSFIAFGGINPRNNSSNFTGGSITALFGGAEVDLREAQLSPDGANLDLTVAFGGVDVFVPENWQVHMSGIPIFGGWEDNTRAGGVSDPTAPVLKVSTLVAFGGAEVKN